MTAFGLFRNSKNAYFRTLDTIIDFILLGTSWCEFVLLMNPDVTISHGTFLMFWRIARIVRCLRYFRFFKHMEALNVMNNLIMTGLYNCRMVYLLIGTYVLFNCCLGVSFFRGQLRNKCAVAGLLNSSQLGRVLDGAEWTSVTDVPITYMYPPRFCRPADMTFSSWGHQCGNAGVCVPVADAAFSGFLNFDHVGSALMTVIVTLLVQDWEGIMSAMMDGTAPVSCIFFVSIIVMGFLFLLNYIYAILCLSVTSLRIDARPPSRSQHEDVLLQIEAENLAVPAALAAPAAPSDTPTKPPLLVPPPPLCQPSVQPCPQ
jgi:hypothetical protein